ncbi:tail fiber domain-containing protein [Dyadobacter beijingensis]|nr:tail fiber domain-containing protein [Dyadobacter beijingensis]
MKKLQKAGRMAWGVMALSLVGYAAQAQVGIGTETPQAKLHVHGGGLQVNTANLNPDVNPFYDDSNPEPVESRLRWYDNKCAFRVITERVGNGGFDIANIGMFSFASGFETFASGNSSTALGLRSVASGNYSFAAGFNSTSSGLRSIAQGNACTASGISAVALGSFCTAGAEGAVAIGNLCSATADKSIAIGNFSTADGTGSIAMGQQVGTNGKSGSFVFGDYTNISTKNDANNQMMMRFTGGYKLYANDNANIGVELKHNQNSWSVLSDVRRKENFAPVNGEDFLNKINAMNLTSWNYKGQDPKQFRHYGPMAQDFYKAFGQDAYGTVGSDTTINQADFDGVNLIAIQALIRRMEQMNSDLLAELASIKAQLAEAQSGQARKKRKMLVSRR